MLRLRDLSPESRVIDLSQYRMSYSVRSDFKASFGKLTKLRRRNCRTISHITGGYVESSRQAFAGKQFGQFQVFAITIIPAGGNKGSVSRNTVTRINLSGKHLRDLA